MTQKEIEAGSAAEDASATPATAKPSATAKPGSKKPATIGSSIVIHGDVTGEEDLVVDGSIEGTVNFKDNNLVVRKRASNRKHQRPDHTGRRRGQRRAFW